jgi:hypothetical protein
MDGAGYHPACLWSKISKALKDMFSLFMWNLELKLTIIIIMRHDCKGETGEGSQQTVEEKGEGKKA